jgi:hypothetical protein
MRRAKLGKTVRRAIWGKTLAFFTPFYQRFPNLDLFVIVETAPLFTLGQSIHG